MHSVLVQQKTFRLVPSHYPPIALFENLLDADELDMAYALESLTNDRLQDEVGSISLVAKEDRIVGEGSSPIMAAFTHIGIESRFTQGRYGVYYAALSLATALKESAFSRTRFLRATNEKAQTVTMRCYTCHVDAELIDLTNNKAVHHPDSFIAAQNIANQLKKDNAWGILYRSVRHKGGQCIAALRPSALVPPAVQSGHYQYIWDGKTITNVLQVNIV